MKKKKFIDNVNEIIERESFKRVYLNGIKTNYIISSKGVLINDGPTHKDPVKLKYTLNKDGHYYAKISINGKRGNISIHRLVARLFIPNPENKPIVHHLDKNPLNNNVSNLVWCTQKEHKEYHKDEMDQNRKHCKIKYGEECNLSKYKESQIKKVCELLEKKEYTLKEISDITGVRRDTISRIRKKQQWCKISSKYNI